MLINFLSKPYQSRIDLEYYSTAIYDYVKISTGIASEFRMRIYLENETIPIGYSTFYHIEDAISMPIVKEFYESSDKAPLWVDGNTLVESPDVFPRMNTETSYFFMRKIMFGEQRIGLIMIQLPKSTLKNVDTAVENLSVNSSQAYTIGNKLVYNFTDTPIEKPHLQKLEHIVGNYSDKQHYYGVYKYPQYPFDVVIATPHSPNNGLLQMLVIIFCIFMGVMVFLFIRYSNKIIHDITYCLDGMNEAITNNFQNNLYVNRKDEISVIADRINFLIERIRKLIDINIKQQVAVKSTQLVALQHQINPHFLYNTMEIFSSRMELDGLYSESAAMSAFCRILRYNIDSDTILATIQDELLQAENYLKIQQVREIPFELQVDIPAEILPAKIIKFVIQPFVENSFKFRRDDVPLIVSITARQKGSHIFIVIHDNGMGMTKEHADKMNMDFLADNGEIFRADKEIGLFNINERLKLFYGEEHHIVVSAGEKSEVLCGACFTFSINIEEPPMLPD